MKSEIVKLALSHYPHIAEKFIQDCSVISKDKNKCHEPARIHKKGSTLALFEKAQASQSYEFISALASSLLIETKTHEQGSHAQRKAGDLLINIYRWSEPKFNGDPKIQEIRSQIFPESQKDFYEDQLKNYIDRKKNKIQSTKS